MKNIIFSATATAIILAGALSTQAFAADITEDTSVYAASKDSIPVLSKNNKELGSYYVDKSTAMPVYRADIFEYAKTGHLDIKPFWIKEGKAQKYISDAVNENGDFVGVAEFTIDGSDPGIHAFSPNTDKARSVAFAPNSRRISGIMSKRGVNSDCKEVKLVYLEEIGYVYYINNGSAEYFAAANVGAVDGEIFNVENGGLVEINSQFKALADKKLAEYEEYMKALENLAPGENPPDGYGNNAPMFMADNTPYLDGNENLPTTEAPDGEENPPTIGVPEDGKNPNTGGISGTAAGAAALISIAAGAIVVVKRRENK